MLLSPSKLITFYRNAQKERALIGQHVILPLVEINLLFLEFEK